MFKLTIVQQPEGNRHELMFPGRTTVQEVKTNVYYVTDIPVRHQEWTGWPQSCENDSTLAVNSAITNFSKKTQYLHLWQICSNLAYN